MGFSRQEYWSGVPLPSPISLLGVVYKIHEGTPLSSLYVGYTSSSKSVKRPVPK